MKNTISLSIPEPCHEKWESFNPTTLGGFCSGCQKEVIDFTDWDDDQIKNHFKHRSLSTCGRFKSNQLKNYSITEEKKQFTYKLIPASIFSLILLFISKNGNAQEMNRPLSEIVSHTGKVSFENPSKQDTALSITISGFVYDENNMPMPGVNVVLKGTSEVANTGVDGNFELILKNSKVQDTLIFSFVGYELVEHIVSTPENISVNLKPDLAQLDEVVMVGGVIAVNKYSPRNIWWKIKSLFRRDY